MRHRRQERKTPPLALPSETAHFLPPGVLWFLEAPSNSLPTNKTLSEALRARGGSTRQSCCCRAEVSPSSHRIMWSLSTRDRYCR